MTQPTLFDARRAPGRHTLADVERRLRLALKTAEQATLVSAIQATGCDVLLANAAGTSGYHWIAQCPDVALHNRGIKHLGQARLADLYARRAGNASTDAPFLVHVGTIRHPTTYAVYPR